MRALTGASAVAVSPDGLDVYVAAATTGSIATFTRQPNGSLVQNAGIAGCTTAVATPGCDLASGIGGADAIAISSDGRFVYVAGAADNAIIVFTRDAATGRLQPLAGVAGCLRAGRAGCTGVSGLVAPSALALAPDGTSLYATSAGGTLTAFQRDPVQAPWRSSRPAPAVSATWRRPAVPRSAGSRERPPWPCRATAPRCS